MTIQQLMCGVSSIEVSITSGTFIAEDPSSPYTVTSTYELNSAGTVVFSANPAAISPPAGVFETWLVVGTAGLYEARVTVTSGSLTSGTTGTWLALSTSRQWEVSRATTGSSNVTFTLEIRRASDGTVLDTATITLAANAGV